jgi:ribosomal protein S18 acetylase RimI-like enzyme
MVKPKFRNLGYANKAMQKLIEYADSRKLDIQLTPSDSFGSDYDRLVQWYKTIEFVNYRKKDLIHRYKK